MTQVGYTPRSRDEAWDALLSKSWPREEINPYRLFTFALVPLWLLEQREVSPGAKLLYGRLVTHAGRDGVAYPRHWVLGSELGVSDRQVRRLVAELERHGLIEAMKRSFGGPDRYVFLYHPWMDLPLNSNLSMPVRRTAGDGQAGPAVKPRSGPEKSVPNADGYGRSNPDEFGRNVDEDVLP